MTAETVLGVRSLSRDFGGIQAVSGVSFQLRKGEIVGLIGPNGAGKSSTLHAIMGDAPVTGGEILLDGRPLKGRPEDIARAGVALVPEGRPIFASLTVDENLRLGLAGRRSSAGADADLTWVRELFPVVGEFAGRQAGSLSGGQQQQLAIARALIARPDVLLLDEPSASLDAESERVLVRVLEREAKRRLVVVVAHRPALIAAAGRVLWLEHGSVSEPVSKPAREPTPL